MHLIEDTRQQKGKHEIKHEYWRKQGVKAIRSALPFGDYAAVPKIAVDTKRDIYEIAQNITQDHARFKKECMNAQEFECLLVVLVENLDGVRCVDDLKGWVEPDDHFYGRNGQRRISGKRLAAAMSTMSRNYGVRFEFCTPNEAAQRVLEILGGEQ